MLRAKLGGRLDPALYRFSFLLQRLGFQPNTLTYIGLGLNGLAAWALAEGKWLPGAGLVFLAGFFDILDGAVARNCQSASSFGSFLDSVTDRYSDLSLLVGLFIYYAGQDVLLYQILVGLSIMGSAVVPYARARAEIHIYRCNIGILERPERILLIIFGALVPSLMPVIIWILAIFTNVTVIQRVLYTRQQLEAQKIKE
jgi:CDP-diacylglycerol---glycerol-3-phosphate 3-phosphatidyltransferase